MHLDHSLPSQHYPLSLIMQSSRSKIVRRYSKRASDPVQNQQTSWGNDEVECRGENLCLVKPQEMKELMHKSIGSITFNHPHKNPLGLGTGFLISQNLVLTSAHNIYDRQFKVFHQNLKFHPSAYGLLSNPIEIQSYHLPQNYLSEDSNKRNILYDYALLKLRQSVKQNRFLVLTIGFQGKEEALGIFGYPGRMYETMNKTATLFSVKQYGLELSGRIKTHSEDRSLKRILYEITTFPGQSGSPVIIGSNDRSKVIAIHKGGNNTMGVNYGRRITLDLLIDLQIWREECQGQPFVCIDLTNKCEIVFAGTMFEDAKNMVKEERRKRKGNVTANQAQKGNSAYQQENARLKEEIKNLRSELSQLKTEKTQTNDKFIEKQLTQEKKPYEFSSEKNIGHKNNQQYKPLKLMKSVSFQPQSPSPSSPTSNPKSSSLFWDYTTPYAKNFTITGNKITLKQFGVYQIVSQKPLNTHSQIAFKIIKYGGEKDICFGIITSRKRKQMYSGGLQDEESVGCWSYPKYKEGYIYVNGKKEIDWTSELFLKEGKSLTMKVDQEAMNISFTNSESGYGKQLRLTDNFRSKDIFAFVCMKEKGDSVQVV